MLIKSNVICLIFNKFVTKEIGSQQSPAYKSVLIFHKRREGNTPKQSVIFLGDSLIQGLAVTAVSKGAINYGIGNDTTRGLLLRLNIYDHSIRNASIVILAIGVNDLISYDLNKTKRNFQLIIENLRRKTNVPIIISGILPINEHIEYYKRNNRNISKINHHILNLATTYKDVTFIDMTQLLIDNKKQLKREYHIGDGIHLNKVGNIMWINKLKQTIKKIEHDNRKN